MKPHRATMILVLGILSLLCCNILGIFAWVMGNTDLKAMADGTMDPSGEGMTKAGKILGIIGCVFLIFAIVWITLLGGATILGALGGRH